MKSKKFNLDNFASNELSRNQKITVLGKGDPTAILTPVDATIILTTTEVIVTTTTPLPGPGDGTGIGNGEGRKAR
ncbi:hypothetical protein FLJC2902T_01720 [Flavobacterium limnosediminis JC2902]|uniref:Uncharacterized protein n=1 Tax=Flavobacterium limnosediminis JC2902 TaxID=1341181 RepID=V6STC5_9FLAO|nr:hypothetical protein [Flavobacterium limnosediminis]ESU29699.1 hypothetical protein FLJC2902T_01720 [Flavobacterium limnosediminis JC2902]